MCVKSVQIRSYFWSVFSRFDSEYRNMQTRNNSLFEHFSRSVYVILWAVWYCEKHAQRSVTFTQSNTPSWVFFIFSKLYDWYESLETSHMSFFAIKVKDIIRTNLPGIVLKIGALKYLTYLL